MNKELIAEEESFYLTCGQRWLLHLLEQEPDLARPVQRIYRLDNAFDSSAFLEAFQGVISSHPALRLRLLKTKDGWRQFFPDQVVEISGEEIQGQTPEMRAAYASMLIAEETKVTLDLRKEPPVKVKIIKVNGDYLLSLCIDHLAADEFAFDLLELELVRNYKQAKNDLPVSSIPSGDFAAYLSKEIAQQHIEHKNLVYWQQQFEKMPVSETTSEELAWVPANIVEKHITGETLHKLLSFCHQKKCSAFNAMIAIQLLILADAGGFDELVLNIPVSNRAKATERTIIGNLSTLLHVRFSVIKDEPVSALIVRVRDQVLNAMVHRQYDYSSLSRFISGKKNGAHTNWMVGCNFVVEQVPLAFPNELFAERLDNQPGRIYDIPQTSFTFATRQTSSMLHLVLEWDANTWQVTKQEMESQLSTTIQRFID